MKPVIWLHWKDIRGTTLFAIDLLNVTHKDKIISTSIYQFSTASRVQRFHGFSYQTMPYKYLEDDLRSMSRGSAPIKASFTESYFLGINRKSKTQL